MLSALLVLLIVVIVVCVLAWVGVIMTRNLPPPAGQIAPILVWTIAAIIVLVEIVRVLPRLGLGL